MALYKSHTQQIPAPAEAVFDKLSDLSNLRQLLESIPESAVPADKREMFDAVRVTDQTITFPAGPVGELTMRRPAASAPH